MEKAVYKNEEILFLTSRESDKAALELWLELLTHKNDQILTKARQYLDTKQTLSHFEKFKSRSSVTKSHKSHGESSKYLSASVTSSQRSRELINASLRREEIERQHGAKFRLKQQKNLLELEELVEENRVKLAEATIAEKAILEDMKEKSSSINFPEESLGGSKRTESWVNKTTEEIQSANKTEPSSSAAGFKPLRVNPVNQSFQPAISVLTSQLDEDKTNIRNPFQSRSEKNPK